MKHSAHETVRLSALLITLLLCAVTSLAGSYGHTWDREAYRSLEDKLETGVVFTDLADFEQAQIAHAAARIVRTDDPERVFEEACKIYVELRYGTKMDRFEDIMAQDHAHEDMVADVEARNLIAEIVGFDYHEEIPEEGD